MSVHCSYCGKVSDRGSVRKCRACSGLPSKTRGTLPPQNDSPQPVLDELDPESELLVMLLPGIVSIRTLRVDLPKTAQRLEALLRSHRKSLEQRGLIQVIGMCWEPDEPDVLVRITPARRDEATRLLESCHEPTLATR